MILYTVLALVAVQRLGELVYAERNTKALRARGAIEVAPWQHPWFVLLHASWLLAIAIFVAPSTTPYWPLLAFFFLLQLARLWVLASLGSYWTTRIITLPGAPLVRRGPYRIMRHPNYAIVVAEIAILPLAFGAGWIAIVFSALNALLTAVRIRAENRALMPRRFAQP